VARSGSEDTLEEGKTTASELAVNSGIGKKETIEDSVIDTEQEAADLAKARLNIISDNLVTGSASIVGTPELSPGTIISIDGVGKRFSGKYYVASVTHTIDANGYTTAFNVRKNVI
jgi:phage protein D